MGLITRVVRDEDLASEAFPAARRLADGPARACGEIRTLLRRSAEASVAGELLAETAALSRTGRDTRRGPRHREPHGQEGR